MEICLHMPASGLEVALYRLNPAGTEKQFEPIAGPEPLPPLLAPAGPLDPAAIRTLLETERSSPTYPQIGQILFAAVNRGAVGQRWQELRQQCPDLTTYLWVEHPDLARLPWETVAENVSLLAIEGPLLRWKQALGKEDNSPPLAWPLRVFILNGANPADLGIGAEQEIWRIRKALREAEHSVDLEVLEVASDPAFDLNKLARALKVWENGPHILHIIGHSAAGDDPAIKLFVPAASSNQQGRYLDWTLTHIALQVRNMPDLRLVYLNACRTNVAGKNPLTPLSIAEVFLRRAAAVIAMQADVSGAAAVECAGEFYARLAAGSPPEAALRDARQALLNMSKPTSRDTYAPVLTTRARAGEILRRPQFQWSDDKETRWLNSLELPLKLSVDQVTHRRKLFEVLFHPRPSRRGALVYGEADVGKTWLLEWFSYVLARRGAYANYITMPEATDWLGLLRRIRDGAPGPHSCGLDADLASEFNWKLNYLAGAKGPPQAPPPFPAGTVEADMAGLLPAILGRPGALNEFAGLMRDAMMYALRAQAGRTPLALIFDNVSAPDFAWVKTGLLDSLIGGAPGSDIRIVVSYDGNRSDMKLDFSGWEDVEMGPVDERQLPVLIPELLRRQFSGDTAPVEAQLRTLLGGSLKIKEVYDVCRIAGKGRKLTWALKSSRV